MGKHDRSAGWAVALLLGPSLALAATPPPSVNYQGVLRDQSDAPLTGSFDMVLRFFDADSAGNEILVDRHSAATANPVIVTDGLFNVPLGSGAISDGSGPGTYTSLQTVFRDYASVWLDVTIGTETLSPRTRIHSSPYALNTAQLDGRPADSFIDTSATEQVKNGRLVVSGGSGPQTVLEASNLTPGGIAITGSGEQYGVMGFGRSGGYFAGQEIGLKVYGSTFAAGWFWGTNLANGVFARAESTAAGHFESANSYAPSADLASGNIGVWGNCPGYGCIGVVGYGERKGVTGTASGTNAGGAIGGDFTASGLTSIGVKARGITGGLFSSAAFPGLEVRLADGGRGVWVEGAVSEGIGVSTSGTSSKGVSAVGGAFGGYFQSTNLHGVYASGPDHGVDADGGNYGGYFEASNVDSYGVAAFGVHTGVFGKGQARGGYFTNFDGDYASLADAFGYGILAHGTDYGGHFEASTTSNWAELAVSSWKVRGVGVNSFVQNHPADPTKVVVYVSPEGDEAAVYTRGSGRLVNGQARVRLGETFALVANPDIGLTATVTPRGEPVPLAVSEVSPGEIVVLGPSGSNAEFDYMVWGLRIGFEEMSVIAPKQRESKIPSMHEHEQYFRDEPALREYTALARFKGSEEKVHGRRSLDFSRADRLREAVGVAPYREADRVASPMRAGGDPISADLSGPADGPRESADLKDAGNNLSGPTITLPAGLDLFTGVGVIEVGDVVSLAPSSPGSVARSSGAEDPLVIGCAQASPETGPVVIATSHIALCRVDASYGAVAVGDRLSPSQEQGVAVRAVPGAAGVTILGRAIDPLDAGSGVIRVLLGAR